MAYCVRCGVKLTDGAKSCPLCGTEVHLPAGIEEPVAEPLFAEPLPKEGTKGITKAKKGMLELIIILGVVGELTVAISLWIANALAYSFIPLFSIGIAALSLLAIVLAKPKYVQQASWQCLLMAVLFLGLDGVDFAWFWSLIGAASLLLFWFCGVFPWSRWAAEHKKVSALMMLASIIVFLVFMNILLSQRLTWFAPVALPMIAFITFMTGLFYIWLTARKIKRIPVADMILGILVIILGSCTAFDFFLTHYQKGFFALRWATSLGIAAVIILTFLIGVSVSLRFRRFFTSHNQHD